MANVTVSTIALENIGWNIDPQDKGHDLEIHWGAAGRVRAMRPDVDGGDWINSYLIDRDAWIEKDLPALKEANELENENYSV